MNNISPRLFFLNAFGPFRKSEIIEVREKMVITIDNETFPIFLVCRKFDTNARSSDFHAELHQRGFINAEDDEVKLLMIPEGFSLINKSVDFAGDAVLVAVKKRVYYRYPKSSAENRLVPSH